MRLIVKERTIREEKIGDKFYLYHATITKSDFSFLHSFRNGISARKSAGMAASQGQGFYLFTDKAAVIKRTKSSMFVSRPGAGIEMNPGDDQYIPFDSKRDGYPLIVTLEADDMDPIKFDLDSEVSARSIIEIMLQNINLFKDKEFISGGRKIKVGPSPYDPARQFFFWDITNGPPTGRNAIGKFMLRSEDDPYTQADADILGPLLSAIQEADPTLFHELERKMFDKAQAIKYVGPELIKPFKLEIIDENGKLIDVTSKDP